MARTPVTEPLVVAAAKRERHGRPAFHSRKYEKGARTKLAQNKLDKIVAAAAKREQELMNKLNEMTQLLTQVRKDRAQIQRDAKILHLRLQLTEDSRDWQECARRSRTNPPSTLYRRASRSSILAELNQSTGPRSED